MVKICQTGLLKSNCETRPKKRIFRFLPKISAGHGWSWKFFLAHFQILGPLGCQGWVVIPQNVKKSQNHCTLVYSIHRVPDCLPSIRIGSPPPIKCVPPLGPKEGGATLTCGWGGGGPNSDSLSMIWHIGNNQPSAMAPKYVELSRHWMTTAACQRVYYWTLTSLVPAKVCRQVI
jgi:hypothetical protein